jgi:hypothetical protein
VTDAPVETSTASATPRRPASTRDYVYGLLLVVGLVVLLFTAFLGLLAALGFFGCGCTTVPATPA